MKIGDVVKRLAYHDGSTPIGDLLKIVRIEGDTAFLNNGTKELMLDLVMIRSAETPAEGHSRISLKRGWYDTEWGNVAYVSGPKARTAHDVDMNERVPVECLCRETWRPATRENNARKGVV